MTIEEALKQLTLNGDPIFDDKGYLNENGYESLDTIQGAEIVKLKKGKWITKHEPLFYQECSECHTMTFVIGMYFCPNCGADMREEDNDN